MRHDRYIFLRSLRFNLKVDWMATKTVIYLGHKILPCMKFNILVMEKNLTPGNLPIRLFIIIRLTCACVSVCV
jgi:hypothetical protein